MKTVGIFGDSHADCTYIEWSTTYKNIGPGWPELLASKYRITNFAEGGSSMYYSYDLFKKMQNNFDIIIYVPTQEDRFSITCIDEGCIRHMVPGFLLSNAERELLNVKNKPNDYKAIQAAIGYVSYILNQEKETEIKRLLLQEVKRLRPDTIIVPAFRDDRVHVDNDIDVCTISNLELDHYGTTLSTLRTQKSKLLDIRKCHLTDGNNNMVFQKVLSAIENNDTVVRLLETDFVAPSDPFNKYFVYENGRTNI